jgi:DNA polymerase V
LKPTDNEIAIFSVNYTDYTIKRLDKKKNQLIANIPNFKAISILEEDVLICFGVVKHIIRDL